MKTLPFGIYNKIESRVSEWILLPLKQTERSDEIGNAARGVECAK